MEWAYYTLAQNLAAEAGDGTRLALALGARSFLVSSVPRGGQGGPQPQALALLQEADRAIGRAGPAPLRGWLWARQAEEHAIAGEERATGRALERAEVAVSTVRSPDDGFLNCVDDAWLTGYRGSCAVLLGRPATAATVLEGAVRADLALRTQRSTVLTDLAAACAQQGDPERACSLLGQSLTVATREGLAQELQRIAGTRRHLDRWDDHPAVRHLDQQLRAQLVA